MALRPCPVRGCPARISLELLLCQEHWRSLAPALQRLAWSRFRAALAKLEQSGAAEPEAPRQAADEAVRSALGEELLEQLGRALEWRSAA